MTTSSDEPARFAPPHIAGDHEHQASQSPSGKRPLSRRQVLAGTAATAVGVTLGAAGVAAPAGARADTKTVTGQAIRTPEAQFRGLTDYQFVPHYVQVAGVDRGPRLRMHYLDEQRATGSGETIVLLHGNPAWSYQWRHVIPALVDQGHRVIAPDLIGMGRSDKLVDRYAYTYARHVEWLRQALFDELDLRDVTLVVHDWGGGLGLRLLAEHPDRFRRVLASDTKLHTGDDDLGSGWQVLAQWLQFSQRTADLRAGFVVEQGTVSDLHPAVAAAYDAPFPDEAYRAAIRQFPVLIPIAPWDEASPANRSAWRALEQLRLPFLTAFSDHDPTTSGGDLEFRRRIPGAQGQRHTTITDAGHFVTEDKPREFADILNEFVATT